MPIKAVIGGLHLKLQSAKDYMAGTKKGLHFIADEIARHKIDKIYTGHCTGGSAYRILKEKLRDRLESIYTGRSIQM